MMITKFVRAFSLVMVMIMTTQDSAHAQTTPTDPALAALQAKQAEMDARLKIQQDQAALLTGALPSSTTAPNTGAFTVTGTPFPSQRLAYVQLQKIAEQIAAALKARMTDKGPVLIYDQAEIGSVANYRAISAILDGFNSQVQKSKKTFDDELQPQAAKLLALPPNQAAAKAFAPILFPALALTSLKTASDIAGMFRTNTNIAFSSFTLDDAALAAEVLKSLGSDAEAFMPGTMPLNVATNTSAFQDKLTGTQGELAALQSDLSLTQARLQQLSDALAAYIQADQASLANQDQIAAETDAAKQKALQTKQASLDRTREVNRQYALKLMDADTTAKLDAATANVLKAERDQFLKVLGTFITATTAGGTAFSTFQTAINTAGTNGTTPLAAILRTEKFVEKVMQPNARILLVKSSVLGGSVVTRTNLFTGGHLLYTGGAIANYTLFDASGAVVASGIAVGESDRLAEKF